MSSRNIQFTETPIYRLYVGNLPRTCLQSHIEEIFSGCDISSIRLIRDRATDAFKGFAYVEFRDEQSYNKARSYDGTIVNGQEIRVNDADRGGNRGGRGRNDYNGRNSNVRSGGGNRGMGGNGYGNRPRPGAYRPRVQPGNPLAASLEEPPMSQPSSRPVSTFIPPPKFDDPDRPRISLKPRTAPLNVHKDEQEQSERYKAIFGGGKPRDPSPKREEDNLSR